MEAYISAHHTLSWADFWYVPQREVLEGGPGGCQGNRGGGAGAESTVQRGGSAGALGARAAASAPPTPRDTLWGLVTSG